MLCGSKGTNGLRAQITTASLEYVSGSFFPHLIVAYCDDRNNNSIDGHSWFVNRYSLDYDPRTDVARIRAAKKNVARTVEIDSTTIMDLDRENHIVGVEILNFSKTKIDISQLITKQLGNLVSVAE